MKTKRYQGKINQMVSEMEADSLRLSIVIYDIRLSQIPYAHTIQMCMPL